MRTQLCVHTDASTKRIVLKISITKAPTGPLNFPSVKKFGLKNTQWDVSLEYHVNDTIFFFRKSVTLASSKVPSGRDEVIVV